MQYPQSYSLQDYWALIANLPRTEPYRAALHNDVHPGDVVVDLGCGTGIFALLACQFGASHVYAIEPSDSILVAQEIARENGFDDRITFIQEISSAIELPQLADVIVSDLRSVLPLFQGHIPSIVDVRQRWLKENGLLIPRQDVLFAAVVENGAQYQRMMASWIAPPYSLKMESTRRYLTNTWEKANLAAEQLLSDPRAWVWLDYQTMVSTNVRAEITAPILQPGTAHGLGVWFDAELSDGIGFSNAPGAPPLVYGQAFFPFPQPISVRSGDLFSIQMRADLIGGNYAWTWKTHYTPSDQTASSALAFEQSTIYSQPVPLERLKKTFASFTPSLSEDGFVDRFILEAMDGGTPLAEIARLAAERFPQRFPTWKAALTRCGELSKKYAQ
jgi:type I protein arginine methyltransferase